MSDRIHNEMAKFAYDRISQRICGKKIQKEFRSLARSFPSMLQINGLGAAAAFLFSKGGLADPYASRDKLPVEYNNTHEAMYRLIEEWTSKKFGKEEGDLMKRITAMDSKQYRMCTNEVMNLCLWVKRFAEGLLEKDE